MVSVVGPASGLVSVVEPVSGLVSTVASALTDGATSAAPTAKTSEQPKRKCFPFGNYIPVYTTNNILYL